MLMLEAITPEQATLLKDKLITPSLEDKLTQAIKAASQTQVFVVLVCILYILVSSYVFIFI